MTTTMITFFVSKNRSWLYAVVFIVVFLFLIPHTSSMQQQDGYFAVIEQQQQQQQHQDYRRSSRNEDYDLPNEEEEDDTKYATAFSVPAVPPKPQRRRRISSCSGPREDSDCDQNGTNNSNSNMNSNEQNTASGKDTKARPLPQSIPHDGRFAMAYPNEHHRIRIGKYAYRNDPDSTHSLLYNNYRNDDDDSDEHTDVAAGIPPHQHGYCRSRRDTTTAVPFRTTTTAITTTVPAIVLHKTSTAATATATAAAAAADYNTDEDEDIPPVPQPHIIKGRHEGHYSHYSQQQRTAMSVLRLRGGHCQVPCGIFDDPATVGEVQQAAATIRKAMVQVHALTSSGTTPGPADYNQLVRWITTKEDHACQIITTISDYGLCQRVKRDVFASDQEFTDAVLAHHAVMIAAMKCKQSVETATVDNLDTAIALFAKMYLPSSK